MEEVSLDIIKATQSSLGKYVKKPPLTEKLLKKPPFRFLHDIITSIIKNTGFFEGLFDKNELISENVKDRDSKIAFLNKMITVLVSTTGKPLDVKPNKIVAGQEPEKTNQLLQLLADALDKKLSSSEAVNKLRNVPEPKMKEEQIKKEKVSNKNSEAKKLKSKSSEKLSSTSRTTNAKNIESNKQTINDKNPRKKEDKNNTLQKARTQINNKKINPASEKTNTVVEPNSINNYDSTKHNIELLETENKRKDSISAADDDILANPTSAERLTLTNSDTEDNGRPQVNNQLNTSYTIDDKVINSSASSQDLLEEEPQPSQDTAKHKSEVLETKPQVARALEEKHENDLQQRTNSQIKKLNNNTTNGKELKKSYSSENHHGPTENLKKSLSSDDSHNIPNNKPSILRPSSSRPGAPRLKEKHENILTVVDNLLVGKVNIIEESTTKDEDEDTGIVIVDSMEEASADVMQSSTNQHGHLVQQILDSQKEFTQTRKTDIEWQLDALKTKEYINREMEQVRISIQGLSRVANPLGKLLDHVQEDVEVMRQELEQWKLSYAEASRELKKQKTVNEDSLQPLYSKTQQLSTDIQEKRYKIDDLKSIVLKNKARIDKLLST